LSHNILIARLPWYRKIDGKWSYVTWDEGHGYHTYPLGADEATFEVLENGKYAKDKNKVYYQRYPLPGADPSTFTIISKGEDYAKDKNKVFYQGTVIPGADPNTYHLLKGTHYAKDKDQVYIYSSPIISADPQTFTAIKFPYARDKNNIYCGTLKLDVQNIAEFEVIEPAKYLYVTDKNDFVERNKEFSYLRDYPIDTVVSTVSGKAKTKTEYFEGCKKKARP
jgi:hypothetical protein